MSIESNLYTDARKSRRVAVADKVSPSSVITILPPPDRRKNKLQIPYPSEIFPTDYNERLPEWRWRASHSAQLVHWKNWKEFQFAALGAVLGLNNIMLFPLQAAKNGRCTYLLAYLLFHLLIGYPILFLQMALGQFTSKGSINVFNIVPLAKGIGYTLFLMNIFNIIRFSVRLSRIVFFALSAFHIQFSPFVWDVPWRDCTWTQEQTEHCFTCANCIELVFNISPTRYCPYQYYHDQVLKLDSDDCQHTGIEFKWRQIGCLFLVYLGAYAFVVNGIKSVGKVVLYTVPLAFICLVVFLLVELFREGNIYPALTGIGHFFTPDFDKLKEVEFWFQVVSQALLTLKLDEGTMIVIGSYARFQSATHYHAFYVCIVDVLLSLLATLIVHCHWGIETARLGVDIKQLYFKTSDPEKNFYIAISNSIDEMNAFSPFWVFVFFAILFISGIMNLVASSLLYYKLIYDAFPHLKKRQLLYNMLFYLGMFAISIPFVTLQHTLSNWLTSGLFRSPPGKYCELFLIAIMVSSIVYLYGLNRLRQDIDFMLQFYPNMFFVVIWTVSPFIIIAVVLMDIIGTTDDFEYSYPVLTGLVLASLVLPIPAMAIYSIFTYHKRGALHELFTARIPQGATEDKENPFYDERRPDTKFSGSLTRQEARAGLQMAARERRRMFADIDDVFDADEGPLTSTLILKSSPFGSSGTF